MGNAEHRHRVIWWRRNPEADEWLNVGVILYGSTPGNFRYRIATSHELHPTKRRYLGQDTALFDSSMAALAASLETFRSSGTDPEPSSFATDSSNVRLSPECLLSRDDGGPIGIGELYRFYVHLV